MFIYQSYLQRIHKINKLKIIPFRAESETPISRFFLGQTKIGKQKCVVKLANPISTSNTKSIENEIHFLSILKCKYIIKMIRNGCFSFNYLTGQKVKTPYLIIPLYDNDLLHYVEKQQEFISFRNILITMSALTKVITLLQQKQIIHADISFSNMVVKCSKEKFAEVKLIDFGRAKIISGDSEEISIYNQVTLFQPFDKKWSLAYDLYSIGKILDILIVVNKKRLNDIPSFDKMELIKIAKGLLASSSKKRQDSFNSLKMYLNDLHKL